MPKCIGFTGTQKGLSVHQRGTLRGLLVNLHESHATFVHGDCIGADAQAHEIALEIGYDILIRPPEDEKKRAFCGRVLIAYPSRPYLDRNKDIVKQCDYLVACPRENEERLRSGTWATVRYARRVYKPITIVYPDGSYQEEYYNEISIR